MNRQSIQITNVILALLGLIDGTHTMAIPLGRGEALVIAASAHGFAVAWGIIREDIAAVVCLAAA